MFYNYRESKSSEVEAKRKPMLAIQLISNNSGSKVESVMVRSSFDELQALPRRGVASRGYIPLV